ncbi:hypothetical protein BDW75DRAFT_239271 [Aspergillus navahoensis]
MESVTQALTEDVRYLTGYLEGRGYPRPSFDRDTPTTLEHDASQNTQSARKRIMSHALQLYHVAAGPSEYLATLQTGHLRPCPSRRVHDYSSLANKARVPTAHLKSILRRPMTSQLFTEVADQRVAHTATSAWLRTNQNSRDWTLFMCDISAPTAAAMAEAHRKWLASTARTHTALSVISNSQGIADKTRETMWLLKDREDLGFNGWDQLLGKQNISIQALEVNHFSMVRTPGAAGLAGLI